MSTTRADFEVRLQRLAFRGILATLAVELEVARWSARSATLELRLTTSNTEHPFGPWTSRWRFGVRPYDSDREIQRAVYTQLEALLEHELSEAVQWDDKPLFNCHRRETAASTWPPAGGESDMDALDYVEEP